MTQAVEVSVILPTFNRLAYLREAVNSALIQSFTDWELIIADDGSGEETRAYLASIRDPRVTILPLPHSGNPAAMRNRAIASARGFYVAFLDSDDIWTPRKLEVQLALMRAHRDRRWSYTGYTLIDENGDAIGSTEGIHPWTPYEGRVLAPLLRLEARIGAPTVIAVRDLVNEVGGFDAEQRLADDYDMWLRLALRSEVTACRESLVWIRDRHLDRYTGPRPGFAIQWYQALMQVYRRTAARISDRQLRSLCHRRRAETALLLAGEYVDRSDRLAVLKTLASASWYGWPFPEWRGEATRTALRPFVPLQLRTALRAWKKARRSVV
jgi:glycosyltransferase involved in cell wall biosynthesis